MNKILYIAILSILVFTIGCKKDVKKENKEINEIKPLVETTIAKKTSISEIITTTGIIEPWQQADLTPSIPGKVKKIYVSEGDRVKKGQLLALMDETQLESLKSAFEVTKANYNRMKNLRKAGAVSKSSFEQTEMAYKQAKLSYQNSLENTKISAPFYGVVTAVTKQEGEMFSGAGTSMLSGGASGLIQVANLSYMKMDIMVSDNIVIKLKKNMPVNIKLDIYEQKTFRGKINWINPSADPVTKTFKVRVKMPNRENFLKGGFYGRAEIITNTKQNTITVPESAVINGKYLYVVNSKNEAKHRKIKTGIINEQNIEIIEGLKPGETVIIKGNRILSDGIVVKTN